MSEVRQLIEPGWTASTFLPALDEPKRVLHYPDGSMGFEHRCKTIGDTEIVCAPRLQLASGGHRVVTESPLTVEPSILCPDCGTHGFIREGRWVEA